MKKNILILSMVIFSLFLTSCGDSKIKQVEKQDELIDKVAQLENKSTYGEISQEEYEKQSENLEQEMIKNSKKLHNQKDVDKIPDWATRQGFRKIEGLELNKDESSMDEFSVKINYDSDNVELLIKKAEELAKDLNIEESPISPRLQINKLLKSMPAATDEMKAKMKESMAGVMFANCDVEKCDDDLDYVKIVIVSKAEKGYKLETMIQDYQKIKKMLK